MKTLSQPIPASAGEWTNLFILFFIIGFIAGATVIGYMTYLAAKNRLRKGKPESTVYWAGLGRSPARETVIFASISAILLFGLAVGSYRMSASLQNPPQVSQSLVIDVVTYQWSFAFHYPNNVSTVGECFVPAETQVIFNVTSSDVMHNFGLAEFRVKIDAIPGRFNIIWITTPSLNGNSQATYTIRCFELCGTGHTYMVANLTVMQPAAFNQWISSQTGNMNMTKGG